jgi:hypothetical protein
MRPAQNLAAIPAEVRCPKSAFAARTTNEIDELFVRVEARVQGAEDLAEMQFIPHLY